MKTIRLVVFTAAAWAVTLDAADAPQVPAEITTRRESDLKRFIQRCDEFSVVMLVREERLDGKVIFTCREILKAAGTSPSVGQVFEFPVGMENRDGQPHEAVLFLRRFPTPHEFLAHRLVNGKYDTLAISDLRDALHAK